jgi:hypothetical protein
VQSGRPRNRWDLGDPRGPSGAAVAPADEPEPLGDLPLPPGIAVDAEDALWVGSRATTLEHRQRVHRPTARAALTPVTVAMVGAGDGSTGRPCLSSRLLR